MKLRIILMVLSLLAFLSATAGGYLYYSSLKESAFKEAERQAVARLEMIKVNLSSLLSEHKKSAGTLAGIKEISQHLVIPSNNTLISVNSILDHFKASLDVEVCYILDENGNTIASSNRNDEDSFVGINFSFRPYFKQAISNNPATYLALGVTSKRRGAYYSYPVYGKKSNLPVGLVVIKASIQLIEEEISLSPDEIVLVTDPHGIIFISNRKEWLYNSIWKLSADEKEDVIISRQFGEGPWLWNGLSLIDDKSAEDSSGKKYLMRSLDIDNFSGWKLVYLRDLSAISKIVSDPLLRITGPIVLALTILIGVSVFFLYGKATEEILLRRSVENALRESEERYRSLYNNTPAMLHSVDPDGRLVSVSEHWLDVMGYERGEVIGRMITDFYSEESRKLAREVVIPEFFRKGYYRDVQYRFVKKNGEEMDILLSAIADRDSEGIIKRSLSVSIDITERKRAEEALKIAKEELSRYSKELEMQVRKRTREITSIFKYTPAVVYMKDKDRRCMLVNSRYEELFGVRNEEIRGKTDYEILPEDTADCFRTSDLRVLETKQDCQFTENIRHEDGIHTYLSVKFPTYDETGAASGICAILTDITALKKAQDQLKRLSGSIITNQENERHAIARELHDELGQVLTALRMDSVWMYERLKESDKKAAQRALSMCDLVDKNIQDVRNMAIRLRPGVLDDLGLVDALEWYTSDFERRTGITCIFEHYNIPGISESIATASYRITQEALTNVARHAGASKVDVILRFESGILMLFVSDNGKGFSISALGESEGLGVAGMRERAGLVGGVLRVQSAMEKGATILFSVPVDEQSRSL
ncbi:MAG: PAS domain S-box protein [Proteobacteria bacterium]|nr:PAS domain S-box protein [Pseudomonadota bacterium]